jgi:hypothetical protein
VLLDPADLTPATPRKRILTCASCWPPACAHAGRLPAEASTACPCTKVGPDQIRMCWGRRTLPESSSPPPPSTCTAVAMVLGLGGATWWWFYTKKDLEQKQGEGERSGGALKRGGGAQCTTANLKGGTAAAPELHCCRGRIQGSPAVPGLPSLHHSGSRGQVWCARRESAVR